MRATLERDLQRPPRSSAPRSGRPVRAARRAVPAPDARWRSIRAGPMAGRAMVIAERIPVSRPACPPGPAIGTTAPTRRRMIGSVGFHSAPVDGGRRDRVSRRARLAAPGRATEAVAACSTGPPARGSIDPGRRRPRRTVPRSASSRHSASARSGAMGREGRRGARLQWSTGHRSSASSKSRRASRRRDRDAARPERHAVDAAVARHARGPRRRRSPTRRPAPSPRRSTRPATYAQDGVGRPRGGYEYARTQNPTRERLERAVAALEGGAPRDRVRQRLGDDRGHRRARRARATRSSSATTSTAGRSATSSASTGRAGVAPATSTCADAAADALWEALTERTRLVWFETPSNPLLKVIDIAAVAATVRGRPAQAASAPLVVVDNTFASPALQRPLELGADIVFHSATKYLGGHSDTIHGRRGRPGREVAERLRFLQNAMGAVPGPFDCFLVLRGLRTLALRVERHARTPTRSPGSSPARRRRVGRLSGPRRRAARPSRGRDSPPARCGTAAGWSRSCRRAGGRAVGTRRASGRSRSASPPGCSPSPSRWAASSRSSRSPRR